MSQLRKNKIATYALRRDWGLSLDIVCPQNTTYNSKTGEITKSVRRLTKIKAIVGPYRGKYEQDGNAKPLGSYDLAKRRIILLFSDLPADFTLTKECHFEFKNKRWEIDELYFTEDDSSWAADVSHVGGSSVNYNV